MNINTSYDCEIGYSYDTNQFYFRADHPKTGPIAAEKEMTQEQAQPSSDLTTLFSAIPEGSNIKDRPNEGPWLSLEVSKQQKVPCGALIRAGEDFVRVYSEQVNVVIEHE